MVLCQGCKEERVVGTRPRDSSGDWDVYHIRYDTVVMDTTCLNIPVWWRCMLFRSGRHYIDWNHRWRYDKMQWYVWARYLKGIHRRWISYAFRNTCVWTLQVFGVRQTVELKRTPVCREPHRGMERHNNSGKEVPSGTYFLRLVAGEHTATRKLCVVR